MRAIGQRAGKRVTCVLTDMDAPIGRTIGNALEIRESIEVLRGGGPADTRELTLALGAEMLVLGGVATRRRRRPRADRDGARRRQRRSRCSASVVEAQGGDPRVCDSPGSVLPQAAHRDERRAARPGAIIAIDSEALGIAALLLGAGRRTRTTRSIRRPGCVVDAYLGEVVEPGAPPQVMLHHGLAPDDAQARRGACDDRARVRDRACRRRRRRRVATRASSR